MKWQKGDQVIDPSGNLGVVEWHRADVVTYVYNDCGWPMHGIGFTDDLVPTTSQLILWQKEGRSCPDFKLETA